MVTTRRFHRDLPEVPGARRFAAEVVAAAGAEASDDLLLVVSELVTNAVRHGDGEVELRIEVDRAAVRIEVLDGGHVAVAEPSAQPPVAAGSGRGLHLVRSVAQAWGTGFDHWGRTLVWAEVPLRRLASVS